jgi:hypothetical protein
MLLLGLPDARQHDGVEDLLSRVVSRLWLLEERAPPTRGYRDHYDSMERAGGAAGVARELPSSVSFTPRGAPWQRLCAWPPVTPHARKVTIRRDRASLA